MLLCVILACLVWQTANEPAFSIKSAGVALALSVCRHYVLVRVAWSSR